MFNALIYFIIREKRNVLSSKIVLPARFLSSTLNILMYYFASIAFKPEEGVFSSLKDWSLFEFLIIGEITLFFIMESLIIYAHKTRSIIFQNCLDPLLNTLTSFPKCLLLMGFSGYVISALTIIYEVLLIVVFFDFGYSPFAVFKAVILNLAFLPLFIATGLTASGMLIIFRRGGSFLGYLTGALGVLSGAYFPTSVFPKWLESSINLFNPIQVLIKITRSILKNQPLEFSFYIYVSIAIGAGLFSLFLSILFLNYAINNYKKRGRPILLGT